MNTDLKLPGGLAVSFQTLSGEVIEAAESTSYDIRSSGGGGYVGRGTGRISAPTITSRAIPEQTVWIRDTAGKEHQIKLIGITVPLRAGHQVSFVLAARNGQESFPVRAHNHTTGSDDLLVDWEALVRSPGWLNITWRPRTVATNLIDFLFFGGLAAVPGFFAGAYAAHKLGLNWLSFLVAGVVGALAAALVVTSLWFAYRDRKAAVVERVLRQVHDQLSRSAPAAR